MLCFFVFIFFQYLFIFMLCLFCSWFFCLVFFLYFDEYKYDKIEYLKHKWLSLCTLMIACNNGIAIVVTILCSCIFYVTTIAILWGLSILNENTFLLPFLYKTVEADDRLACSFFLQMFFHIVGIRNGRPFSIQSISSAIQTMASTILWQFLTYHRYL